MSLIEAADPARQGEPGGRGWPAPTEGPQMEMLRAVLSGQGLGAVAELAARAVGRPVAILAPGLGTPWAASPDACLAPEARGELEEHVARRLRGQVCMTPREVAAEVEIADRDGRLGMALMLRDGPHEGVGHGGEAPGHREALGFAAVAALTEKAIREARREGEDRARGELARRVMAALGRHSAPGGPSFSQDPASLAPGLREAELMLEAPLWPEGAGAEGSPSAETYRLLLRLLSSHPEELGSFVEETIGPLVRHDERCRAQLLPTLEAYLEKSCNMNATAEALDAHRHTVAYRLERIQELTALDPRQVEGRERLGLGLKGRRILLAQRAL